MTCVKQKSKIKVELAHRVYLQGQQWEPQRALHNSKYVSLLKWQHISNLFISFLYKFPLLKLFFLNYTSKHRMLLTQSLPLLLIQGQLWGVRKGWLCPEPHRSPDGCEKALIQKLAYNSIAVATSSTPPFKSRTPPAHTHMQWCQPRSQMHTWEAKRARSEVLPESKELDPGWVALIWLSLVSSKTNRLRHGGLSLQTHSHTHTPAFKQARKQTHPYTEVNTHLHSLTHTGTEGLRGLQMVCPGLGDWSSQSASFRSSVEAAMVHRAQG